MAPPFLPASSWAALPVPNFSLVAPVLVVSPSTAVTWTSPEWGSVWGGVGCEATGDGVERKSGWGERNTEGHAGVCACQEIQMVGRGGRKHAGGDGVMREESGDGGGDAVMRDVQRSGDGDEGSGDCRYFATAQKKQGWVVSAVGERGGKRTTAGKVGGSGESQRVQAEQ